MYPDGSGRVAKVKCGREDKKIPGATGKYAKTRNKWYRKARHGKKIVSASGSHRPHGGEWMAWCIALSRQLYEHMFALSSIMCYNKGIQEVFIYAGF